MTDASKDGSCSNSRSTRRRIVGELGAESCLAPEIDEDGGNVSNTINTFSFGSVDVNIVYDILSRLPVKSLMQLKCVFKHWCSMILKDRYFIDLHLQKSKSRPCLLITVPRELEGYKREKNDNLGHQPLGYCLVIADLLFEGGEVSPVVRTVREIDTPSSRIVGPLNGLICLFDPKKNGTVQVCNLSTREVTPCIKSAFNLNLEDKYKNYSNCFLGFDPATKEHKVICLWSMSNRQVCGVLTVGDCKWRTIDDVPAHSIRGSSRFGASVYVNGSIYFYFEPISFSSKGDKPKFIMVLDVGDEKFRTIGIPDLIHDQISQRYQPFFASVQLLEIDGHPALLSRISTDIAKIWLFDDDYNNGYRSNTWKEVAIQLPFHWEGGGWYLNGGYSVHFHSVIGTDFIILYVYRCNERGDGYRHTQAVSQYSYNWKNKIFKEIKINGLPSSVPYLLYVSGMSTFAESLSPVQ